MAKRKSNIGSVFKSIVKKQISNVQDKLAGEGASFLKTRLTNNYGQDIVEGVALTPHAQPFQEILRPDGKMLDNTGQSKQDISVHKSTGKGKSEVIVDSVWLKYHEEGNHRQVITPELKLWLKGKGIQVKVGNALFTPSRPVVRITAQSNYVKTDLVRYLKKFL